MTKGRWIKLAAGLAALLLIAAMVWHHRNFVEGNLVALADSRYNSSTAAPVPVEERLVAHAGGSVRGMVYTNSRDALDLHYAEGYRVFELDFRWTSDGKLVVIHDWPQTSRQFGVKPHVFSYEEFVSSTRADGLHQLTFEDLHKWLLAHPDAYVVTDTKESNVQFLRYVEVNGADIGPQLIVQVYRMSELPEARKLNPRAVWLTTYKYSIPAWAVSRISGVDGFVVPVESYDKFRIPILAGKVHFYVFTVPAKSVDDTFKRLPGIYGIYVD